MKQRMKYLFMFPSKNKNKKTPLKGQVLGKEDLLLPPKQNNLLTKV